jgi:anti-sigma regulatory factor (Ser/Thr protein kinase)
MPGAGDAGAARLRIARGGGAHTSRSRAGGPGVREHTWHTASALRLSHPADLGELREIRGRLEDWARRHDLPPETTVDLQLTLGEAVSNAIEHAYRGGRCGPRPSPRPTVEVDVELRFTSAGRAVVVCVTDHGRWRPAPAEPGYRGRGLALIEELSAGLQVVRTAEGTQVRFTIPYLR